MNDDAFILFKAIELATRAILPHHLLLVPGKKSDKVQLVKSIAENETVLLRWSQLAADVIDEDDSHELLQKVVDIWVTTRGFALTSKWMDQYKEAKDKALRKSKSLRKQLKGEDASIYNSACVCVVRHTEHAH